MTCLVLLLWEAISSPNAVLFGRGKFHAYWSLKYLARSSRSQQVLEYAVAWILSYVTENSS